MQLRKTLSSANGAEGNKTHIIGIFEEFLNSLCSLWNALALCLTLDLGVLKINILTGEYSEMVSQRVCINLRRRKKRLPENKSA